MTRPAAFDLRAALRAPGFTPRARDAPALMALLLDEEEAVRDAAGRALGRLAPAAPLILCQAAAAEPPLRERLCRIAGLLARRGDAAARAFVIARLADPDERTRRRAAAALGHLPGADSEEALLLAWERETAPAARRALAAALGRSGTTGGARALSLLGWLRTDDAELQRIAGRATLMLARDAGRGEPAALRLDRRPATPLTVAARCRAGLEGFLADELAGLGPILEVSSGEVRLQTDAPPAALLRARTLLRLAFPLPPPARRPTDLAEAAAGALASEAAQRILLGFTEGTARFRLAWASGGHRRALTWRSAALIQARCPTLRNDPRGSLWEAVISDDGALELRPRRPPDDRFAYRKAAVPAASHPTVAAALARAAGVASGDRVWDPFVGSGLELAERSLRGPYASLLGSDIDEGALAAARANLTAAGARFCLERADARRFDPGPVTLVLTNPPMGRRVRRDRGLAALLDEFVDHAARKLRPGGRLVWLSPAPARTAERIRAAGLVLELRQPVDMGGFFVELQRARRPAAGGKSPA